jgi:probable blue pigment (indigoidine) exporter
MSVARRDLLLLALAAASWGVGTVVSKRAVDEIPPFTLLPMQLAASVVVLAALMRASGQPLRGSPVLLARLGILNPGIAYALGLVGLTYLSASLYVLLWALEPLLILLLAGAFLDEGVSGRLAVLSLIAAAGMGLIVYNPASTGQLPGIVLTLVGIGCCAAYSVIARRFVASSDSTAQVVLAQQMYALAFAVLTGIVAALVGQHTISPSLSAAGVVSVVVSGVLYYAAAYWFYLSALRSVPASIAATSFYLIPAFGLGASFLLLGERLVLVQWIGVAIVVLAAASIVRLPRRSAAHRTQTADSALAR